MTNNIIPINKNLIAIETKLGWTLTWFISKSYLLDTIRLYYLDLTELWNLEIIYIKDPAEVKAKENLDIETLKLFQENIKVSEGNRYEVCLPWKDSHWVLGDKAEKRLFTNT